MSVQVLKSFPSFPSMRRKLPGSIRRRGSNNEPGNPVFRRLKELENEIEELIRSEIHLERKSLRGVLLLRCQFVLKKEDDALSVFGRLENWLLQEPLLSGVGRKIAKTIDDFLTRDQFFLSYFAHWSPTVNERKNGIGYSLFLCFRENDDFPEMDREAEIRARLQGLVPFFSATFRRHPYYWLSETEGSPRRLSEFEVDQCSLVLEIRPESSGENTPRFWVLIPTEGNKFKLEHRARGQLKGIVFSDASLRKAIKAWQANAAPNDVLSMTFPMAE